MAALLEAEDRILPWPYDCGTLGKCLSLLAACLQNDNDNYDDKGCLADLPGCEIHAKGDMCPI
jgi:hypothetical protein